MTGPFTDRDIESFIAQGFIKLDGAFPRKLAEEGRQILWKDTGCDPDNPSTWTKPVIRLWEYPQAPFREAANTPILHLAYDQLVGPGRWVPRGSMGSFPVRFPSDEDPGDAGWHADGSFAGEDGTWWLNVHSRERALLMLFLFSDIGENDAPTRIAAGSHFDVAKALAPAGETGMSFITLAQQVGDPVNKEIVLATGEAGTVFLCHPFILHAAQPNRGKTVRFLAQPSLMSRQPIQLERNDHDYSPVEQAIRRGLGYR